MEFPCFQKAEIINQTFIQKNVFWVGVLEKGIFGSRAIIVDEYTAQTGKINLYFAKTKTTRHLKKTYLVQR